MPAEFEIEAKNLDKAVQKASRKLKIDAEAVKYDVISYGSTGIFGLVGAKKAKIRVYPPDVKVEQDIDDEPSELTNLKHAILQKTFGKRRKNTTAENGKERKTAEPEKVSIERFGDAARLAEEALHKIIDNITEDAQIQLEKENDRLLFNINGGNSAVLIGKRGQTLEAIQYLVDKIVNHRREQRVRIQIDIEGYLKTRKANLERLALRLSEKAKNTGKPVSVGQMNAYDRRIVHLALKNDRNVRTQSKGDGFYRKLLIFPKKTGQYRRRRAGAQ